MALETHKMLKKDFPDLQTIIVPRHPERFDGVCSMLEKSGAKFSRASQIQNGDNTEELLIVDMMGALMKVYQLGTIGIVCGSFTGKVGGHNFLEPAFYKKPFVFGPHTYSQPGFYQLCQQAKAGVQCSADELTQELHQLLHDQQKQLEIGEGGHKIIAAAKGAVHHTVEVIIKEMEN